MKIKHVPVTTHSPCAFLTQHATEVLGILSGFDRLRLRASLRSLYQPRIMMDYLSRVSVLLKDFAAFASGWTERVRAAAHQLAEQTGRPVGYLHSSAQRKETLARDLARRHAITSGLIGIYSCVEPCLTYFVRRDRAQKKLVLRLEPGKCLHYYFYYHHEALGFLHLRLQTWFPFQVMVCLNGRHWLAQQMQQAGLGYQQRERIVFRGWRTWRRHRPWPAPNCKPNGRNGWHRCWSNAIPWPPNSAGPWPSPTTGA